jgi:mRNA interferase MazF
MSGVPSPGDIVLVRFPFTSLESAKKRPCLVLRVSRSPVRAPYLTLAMITSKVDGLKLEGDVEIREWKESHLLHPSLVRLSKVATLDFELVERRLGALRQADLKAVRSSFRKLFSAWV